VVIKGNARSNHVHVLAKTPKCLSPAKIVQYLKKILVQIDARAQGAETTIWWKSSMEDTISVALRVLLLKKLSRS